MKAINVEDKKYFSNAYEVSLHNYDNESWVVYASCEQDALDLLVDTLVMQGLTGMFYTFDELKMQELDEDHFIVAGNECYYLDIEHTHIQEMSV